MALLIQNGLIVLVPYWCDVTDGFTLKIQMSSPLLLIWTATGHVSLVSHVHITCWWHDKGKMGFASKSMLTYALSHTLLAVMWHRISDTLHVGQIVYNYEPSKGSEGITKKFECDFSSQEVRSAVTLIKCAPPAGTMREQESHTETTHCAGLRWPLGRESILLSEGKFKA